ncbi:hypothetical protein LguiA_016595 [Lonicera macranthoides]
MHELTRLKSRKCLIMTHSCTSYLKELLLQQIPFTRSVKRSTSSFPTDFSLHKRILSNSFNDLLETISIKSRKFANSK